ncbi:hypothetical protein EDB84DRAFT_1573029 [Lactarius hengduanensis]|nr:hypothetical protein EDB84DRAFT_1573029 [Lactarius hengduanensis]
MYSFTIASVNMRRRNAAMHALLETNETDDILLVQEPWFGHIGTKRADNEREGEEILGGTAHQKWELLYPYFSKDKRAKVMVYKRIHSRENPFWKNALTAVNRMDLVSHPCVQVVDVRTGSEKWRLVNFYHNTGDESHSALDALLNLDLEPTIPTLVQTLTDPPLQTGSRNGVTLHRAHFL